MVKQKSNNKCHDKLKELLESIKPYIMTYANDDDTKILLRNFMDEQFQLCHDYFQYHLDEAKAIALEYQTQISYTRDVINTYRYHTNHKHCDSDYDNYDAGCNIEAFNLMFGFIGLLDFEPVVECLGQDWENIFQTPQTNKSLPCEIIAKDSDPEFNNKLLNLLDSIKTWYIAKNFMDELWPLYLDYFQYHLEEAQIASINYQTLLADNIDVIQYRYVYKQFDAVERITSNEYEDPPWELACEVRSTIEAFNDMFGFLGRLECEELVKWQLMYNKESGGGKKSFNAPPNHWWWIITEWKQYSLAHDLKEPYTSIDEQTESIIVDQFGNNIIKTVN